MTEQSPADRFGRLFSLIGDPVVELELVDRVPVVRAVNPAFEDVFGYEADQIRGESLNDFIVPADHAEEADRFDRRTADNKPNTGLVTRETATDRREFLYRGVPYKREDGQYAFAIYTDVTDQRRYERHIRVVHRLLRHDLRTDLQIIMGTAARVADRVTDEEVASMATTIAERAEHLAAVGEEAKLVEQVVLGDHQLEPVDVAALCRSVAATTADEHPDTAVDVTAPDRRPVAGVQWLRAGVRALVDNAAVHGGDTVTVTVHQQDDRVAIEVADDGPGIPEGVQGPVFDDRDTTPLEHSDGIGLWLARWVAEACRGQVEYHRVDGWTVVTLWLQPAS